MIPPKPSHLSLSCPQRCHHLRTQSWVITRNLCMPWSRVDTDCSILRVQYTLRTAYTEYSIHWVQHTLSTANTKCSIHRVQHTLWKAYAEYYIHRLWHHPKINCLLLSASLSSFAKPYCTPVSTFAQFWLNQSIESQLLSRFSPVQTTFSDWPPPSTSPILLDHGLQVHLHTPSITASQCIWKLAQLRAASSHHHSRQVHCQFCSITVSMCISKLPRLQPSTVSLMAHSYNHQVCTIAAGSTCPNLQHYSLRIYFPPFSIMA